MCGKGYACFFSGFNYQCCPSEDDIDYEATLECPAPALTVLGNDGNPIRCNLKEKHCPETSMFCTNVHMAMICCEGKRSFQQNEAKTNVKDNDDHNIDEQPFSMSESLDCPDDSFLTLDHNGQPVRCDDKTCNEDGRFCYEQFGVSVCCERAEKMRNNAEAMLKNNFDNANEHSVQNPLKYVPPSINTQSLPISSRNGLSKSASKFNNSHRSNHVDGTVKRKQYKQPNQKSNAIIFDDSVKISSAHQLSSAAPHIIEPLSDRLKEHSEEMTTMESNQFDTSQFFASNDDSVVTEQSSFTNAPNFDLATQSFQPIPSSLRRSSNEEHPQLRGVSLGSRIEQIPTETLKYTPHSAGGYAVSRAFSVRTAMTREDARQYARKYLLRQIRNGWPYNDRYYSSAVTNGDGIPIPDQRITFQNE